MVWKCNVKFFWTIVIYSNFREVDIIFYFQYGPYIYISVNIVNRHILRLAMPKPEIVEVEPSAKITL